MADFLGVASQGKVGEYYEAGELGGTHIGGVEGGDEIRAIKVWRLVSLGRESLMAGVSGSALFRLIRGLHELCLMLYDRTLQTFL